MPGGRREALGGAVAVCLLLGCALAVPENPYAGQEPARPVWVVTSGWHTGLAVRRSDIPAGLLPESADFPGATYLEIGWGDRDYYQAREPDLSLTLDAGLLPGPSVLLVAGLKGPPAGYFGPGDTVRLDLPEAPFRRLLTYLHDSFVRNGVPRAPPIAPGLSGTSRFYAAQGRFHVFNNCNVWTARALRAAGLPAVPAAAVTAGGLRSQVQRWGTVEPVPP
ncbi:DUF2459 domain-containing protein [Candidatus Methylocalor cossyra]|uniref:DUF2459 domain-containing protein n=1 Tax=Candidatus Methylocalor cossyra TaxID=3108543 RepID=A0ABM9NHP2_9GAMM